MQKGMKVKKLIFIGMCSGLLMVSCQKDEPTSLNLDLDLKSAMIDAAGGAPISTYMLPESWDYNSIPQDSNNPLTKEKVELGQMLFHETVFATENVFPITAGEYSCASCHHAGAGFQSGMAQGIGEGGEGFGIIGESRVRNLLCAPELCDVQPLRTPTSMNGAYQPLMLWNGQFGATDQNIGTEDRWKEDTPLATNKLGFEGLETQAIAGLTVHRIGYSESAVVEHGYKELWDAAFPEVAVEERYDLVRAGLAIAAYERTVMANDAPFQMYLAGNKSALSDYQKEGGILFFGKAQCASCHNGPALNDMEFHSLGLNEFVPSEVVHYNVDDPSQFGRFSFTGVEADKYKFKTPQLYNLKGLSFFGHGASKRSVKEMIEYKNMAVAENSNVAAHQLSEQFVPLGLTDEEVDKITAFVTMGLYDANLERYVPSELPSGQCFPNNDSQSQQDLGCQ